jgi:hypothetical protein
LRIRAILFCTLSCFAAPPLFSDAGDPPARAARLSYASGTVSLQPPGESQWFAASTNYVVTTGDRLYTDQHSRAELETGPFVMRLSQTTDLTVTNLNDQVIQLGLGQGSIRVTVLDLPPRNSVEIDTPNGSVSVLRPGFYRVDYDPNTSTTLVTVNRGDLEANAAGVSQPVRAGQAAQLRGTGAIQMLVIPNSDEFDEWCAARDRRIRSFSAAQYVNRYTPGVEDLDSYGHWQVVTEYGPVWYPAGVPVGWVPYRFGHWVWIEPWGWTWVEDEPWGFCPFHFGRWALIAGVWGWVPGPVAVIPFYAPALVAFLGGGFSIGIDVQAWFPLGPREPFWPWYHYGPTYLHEVNITNIRNVTNINEILNVTNINNIHYAYKSVATTAVPTSVFRSGQPVARRVVPVAAHQLAAARVAPHPNAVPARIANYGGRMPLGAPLVHGRPSTMPVRTQPVAPVRRSVGPSVDRRVLAGRTEGYGPPASVPPHFATRLPPPPRGVPFEKREVPLAEHSGRPLEPQQLLNLRERRPAGPMLDREFPHPPEWRTPAAAERPAPRRDPRQ